MKIQAGNGTDRMQVSQPAGGPGQDSYAKGIESQIQALQQKIDELGEKENLSAEDKMQKKKEYESEIKSLKQQLQQHKMEQQEEIRRKKAEEVKEKTDIFSAGGKEEGQEGTVSKDMMHAMVSASGSMSQASSINKVKTSLEGDAYRIEGEIAIAKSKLNPPDTSELEAGLAGKKGQIAQMTGKIINKYGEAADIMKKANERDVERTGKKTEEETAIGQLYPDQKAETDKTGKSRKTDQTVENGKETTVEAGDLQERTGEDTKTASVDILI